MYLSFVFTSRELNQGIAQMQWDHKTGAGYSLIMCVIM